MSYVEVPLSQGMVALVDPGDAEMVSQYRWFARDRFGTWYAQRNTRRPDGVRTTDTMHRLLTGWDRTDHINGNGLDNRRSNLRPSSASTNAWNSRSRGGTSRYKGVSWYPKTRRWVARIRVHGSKQYLGYFLDESEAARAYDAAARHHFGQFAAVNFPQPGERCALRPSVGVAA